MWTITIALPSLGQGGRAVPCMDHHIKPLPYTIGILNRDYEKKGYGFYFLMRDEGCSLNLKRKNE